MKDRQARELIDQKHLQTLELIDRVITTLENVVFRIKDIDERLKKLEE